MVQLFARDRTQTTVLQDLKYAVRILAQALGCTTVIVAALALAIGAHTANYSLADTTVNRSAPFD